ncbi:pyridoxal phosphate-dependent transferase [Xylariales sp. PMI_506]|nr:pyridoxal phosphate-dependent transferase [Xylariales sp. PMI_506]
MPHDEMPEDEMSRQVAYRVIEHRLAADGSPALNLGSFVTTQMDDEATMLMLNGFSKNLVHNEAYPSIADIENRCVNMIAHLFNAPHQGKNNLNYIGTSTAGSSEAVLLATLAMKKHWVNKRKAEGKDSSAPNLIMSSAVQVCWKKAAQYFEIVEKYVYCTKGRYTIDPYEAVELVDENTIGICSIMGTTYTGEYEDIKTINDLLIERHLDVNIHIDAASGGFVVPFVNPDLVWDFRLERVASINVSGHKYGLVYAGVGWVIWRSPEYLAKELIFSTNYLGMEQTTFTLNFSRGASHVIGQYYKLISLGKKGYRRIMLDLLGMADHLANALEKTGAFIIMSKKCGQSLPLVAFRLDLTNGYAFDEFALAHELRKQGGWVIPAYTMAPHGEELKLLRVVVREDFTPLRCEALLADIRIALYRLSETGESVPRLDNGCEIGRN